MGLPGLAYIAMNEVKRPVIKNTMDFATFLIPSYIPARSQWITLGYTSAGIPGPDFNTSGFTCNNYTSGAIVSGEILDTASYLTSHYVGNQAQTASQKFNIALCDRLWAATGFNLNTTGAQNVGTLETLPPRDIYGTSSGYGCEIWAEVTNAFNATVGDLVVNYNDAFGNPKSLIYSRAAQAYISTQNLLIGSDVNGISGITSFRFNSTGAGVGRFNLIIARRIHVSKFDDIFTLRNSSNGVLDTCLPIIYPSSCLFGMSFHNLVGTTTMYIPQVIGLCK